MGNPGTQPGGERAHPGLGQPQGVGGATIPSAGSPATAPPPAPDSAVGWSLLQGQTRSLRSGAAKVVALR